MSICAISDLAGPNASSRVKTGVGRRHQQPGGPTETRAALPGSPAIDAAGVQARAPSTSSMVRAQISAKTGS
jgi:hypothetical protein